MPCHLEKLIWNIKARALTVKKILVRIMYSKSGPISKVKDTKCWHPWKGLVTRHTHVKYESSSTHCSKFISKVYKFSILGAWKFTFYGITSSSNKISTKNIKMIETRQHTPAWFYHNLICCMMIEWQCYMYMYMH